MNRRHPIVTEIRHGGHRHAEPLHLLGLEMAEDLGGILFVEAQHQYRRHLHPAHLIQDLALTVGDVIAGDLCLVFVSHLCSLPIL